MLTPWSLDLRMGQEQPWCSGPSGSLCEVYWTSKPHWKVRLLWRAGTEQLRHWWEIFLQSRWSWKEKEVTGTGRELSGCPWPRCWNMTLGGSERPQGLHIVAQMASHTLESLASSEGAGKVYKVPLPSSQ